MADIADVRLFNAQLNFEHFPEEGNDLTWHLEMTPSFSYDEGDDFFILEIEYEVEIQELVDGISSEDAQPRKLATIAFKLGSLYRLDVNGRNPPEGAELYSFSKTTGTIALYPYAREFVQSMSSRMGLPPLTLATFKLPYPDSSTTPEEPRAIGAKAPPRKRAPKRAAKS
ncbi:hypothetical protein GA0070616_2239 [Micromonospora nigra]|uniref:Preprotein translocase subunit SecB n=2 Tax=Micromonospora nigra TaxID=145857 RepID=A0A1C6RVJ6_9ACTN|nr:hypothetical protein GA0070616_2239 [Micromonospora nigra]